MEFWGAEVKSGHNFEVELKNDGGRILHLSQVALGEVTGDSKKEKGKETVCVYLKFKNEKFVIGTLSQEKFPHVALDLVVHDKFELSHNWKNGSVYFTGYYVDTSRVSDTESEEEIPELVMNPIKSQATTSDPTTSKQVKIVEPKKDEESSDGDDDDDDDDDEDEESGEDQEPSTLVNGENESDDDDDEDSDDDSEEESSDEDQETPEKAEPSNKRSTESATKTPAPKKKAKLVTPEKTVHSGAEGKKVSGHTATPHPSKKSGKASSAATQPKQTPNAGGSLSCKSCGRSFGSENALQSHSKAKHGTPA